MIGARKKVEPITKTICVMLSSPALHDFLRGFSIYSQARD
jgi:hypothetical protein